MSGFELNYKNGWIFSPRLDVTLIWGLIALFFFISWIFKIDSFSYWDSVESISTLKIPINMAHVFATFYPAVIRWNFGLLSSRTALICTVGPCLLGLSLYLYSPSLFYSSLALMAISHILLQQYGFVMVSRAKAAETEMTRSIDKLEIFNILLFPILWWLSDQSTIEKTYFVANDIRYLFPKFLVVIAHIAHWFIHIFYLVYLLKSNKPFNFGKLSFMLGTWVWLYFSLVVFDNSFVFWSCLITIHGLYYMIHCHRDYKRRSMTLIHCTIKIFKNPIFYIFSINFLAIIWFEFYDLIPAEIPKNSKDFLESIIWWPLLIHYCIDAVIWKRQFNPSTSY